MANEAHVRIDEGVKRGPRKPQEARRRSPKADLGSWVIPADLNPHDVIQRFLTESTTSHIAAQYGLSRKALVKYLRATVPNEWKEAQVLRALCRKEDGDDGLDSASDALSLACAREQVKSAQWDLERLDHTNYGQKQELTGKDGGPLQVQIVRFGQVIEGEVVADSPIVQRNSPQIPLIPKPTDDK